MGDWEGIIKPITAEDAPRMRKGELTRYVPNHKSFAMFIKSDQVRDPTEQVAEDIAALAKEFSPKSERGGDREGRRMSDRFKVVRNAGLMKVGGNLRVRVLVVNNARSAAPNEFGSSKNKAHRMLARAGSIFGDFKPKGGGVGRGKAGRGAE